ncbi:MAG: hypothetical protein AAF485_03980 [Chloroflexota bacterium]
MQEAEYDADLDIFAVSDVTRMKQAQDIDGLISALEDTKSDVRWAAMRALGELWDIPTLTKLGHRNRKVRIAAIEELGTFNDPRVMAPLIASLKDTFVLTHCDAINEWWCRDDGLLIFLVRVWAVKILCEIGDPIAIKPLIAVLRPNALVYPDMSDSYAKMIYDYLPRMGEPAFQETLLLLEEADDDLVEHAINILEKFGDTRAVPSLARRLTSDIGYVATYMIIDLIYLLEPESAISTLKKVLEETDNQKVRAEISEFLDRIEDHDLSEIVERYNR